MDYCLKSGSIWHTDATKQAGEKYSFAKSSNSTLAGFAVLTVRGDWYW